MSPEEFEALVVGRGPDLYALARLLTGEAGAARDLLQTALVAVQWAQVDAGDATALAHRELVAGLTGWRRRMRVGELLMESPLLAGVAGLPGFGPARADPGPRSPTAEALLRLPPRTRAAVVLSCAGLAEPATADALGCRVQVARELTRAGLDQLRGELDGVPSDRVRQELAAARQQPGDLLGQVRDAAGALRGQRIALAALAAFLVAVVLVVVLSV